MSSPIKKGDVITLYVNTNSWDYQGHAQVSAYATLYINGAAFLSVNCPNNGTSSNKWSFSNSTSMNVE